MQNTKGHECQSLPLKRLGQRVLIPIKLIPFMNLLSPLALALVTLKNPPGMIYSKLAFKHLKRKFLEQTFQKSYLKN